MKNREISVPEYIRGGDSYVAMLGGKDVGVYIIIFPSAARYAERLINEISNISQTNSKFNNKFVAQISTIDKLYVTADLTDVSSEFVSNLLREIGYDGTEELPYILKFKRRESNFFTFTNDKSDDALRVEATSASDFFAFASETVKVKTLMKPTENAEERPASASTKASDALLSITKRWSPSVVIISGLAAVLLAAKKHTNSDDNYELDNLQQDASAVTTERSYAYGDVSDITTVVNVAPYDDFESSEEAGDTPGATKIIQVTPGGK